MDASGNVSGASEISYLLDYEKRPKEASEDYAFAFLFTNWTKLIYAPAISVTPCTVATFEHMFSNTGLIDSPSFSSFSKMTGGYAMSSMFANCVNLDSLPILRTYGLAEHTYINTWRDCKKITVSLHSIHGGTCKNWFIGGSMAGDDAGAFYGADTFTGTQSYTANGYLRVNYAEGELQHFTNNRVIPQYIDTRK